MLDIGILKHLPQIRFYILLDSDYLIQNSSGR